MDTFGWIEAFGNNFRYAARRLRRSPGFAAVAILTLALGIGANVAAFTVVRAVLLNPLPYPHPEQLVRVFDDLRGSNSRDVGMSAPELWDLRDRSGVFADISAIWPTDADLTGADHPERIELLATSTNYFRMLAARPQVGRLYNENDERQGFIDGVVLSDSFWRRTFGGDPNAIGKQVRLDSDLYTIIEILPPEFRHPGRSLATEVDGWTAAGCNALPFPAPAQRSQRMLPGAMGRLKPGLTIAQAQARLNAFSGQLSRQYPNEYPAPARWALRLVPVEEDLVGNMRTELFVLFGAVACVLLIACVNLANLLLARSAGRQREIAVRLALGAGKATLIGQLLGESILLSSISGAVAVSTLVLVKTSLLKLAPPDLPRVNEIVLSPGVLLFAFFVSILTGVIFGLVPALQTVRPNQTATLRGASIASGDGRHNADLELVARAGGDRDEPGEVVSKEVVLHLTDESFAEAMRVGLTYPVTIAAQHPGLYDVRVAVRDTASSKLGSARGFVEVPDLLNGRLAVSGVLLHNGTGELHRFHRRDSLSYMCQAFHVKSAKGEVRIVRDGEQVLAVPAMVVANDDGSVTLQGVVPLVALAPGLYSLQVVATEDGGTDTGSSQWTDFEIAN